MGYFAFTGMFLIPDSEGLSELKHSREISWDEYNKRLLISILNIDDGLSVIPDEFFSGCINLKEINFPASIQRIGKRAFADCISLSQIFLPLGLTFLGDGAFEGCSSLSYVSTDGIYGEFPDNLTYIGSASFRNTAIESISLGSNNHILGNYAFSCCKSLTSVGLYNDVCSIGEYAFEGCSALNDLDVSNSVSYLPATAFHNCISLAPENIPNARIPEDFPDPGPLQYSIVDGCLCPELSNSLRCAISMAPFLDFKNELKLCLEFPHYYFHLSMDHFRIEAWNRICKVYGWKYITGKEFDYIRTEDLYHFLFGRNDA